MDEKLTRFCKDNSLHVIKEEDTGYSILAVDQQAGCFVVVEYRATAGFLVKRYTVQGGLKVYFAPNGEVRIETLPVEENPFKYGFRTEGAFD